MKRFLLLSAILLSVTSFAQQSANRVIIKFNAESQFNDKATATQTGNTAIDEVSKQYNLLSAKKMVTGQKLKTNVFVLVFGAGVDINTVMAAYRSTSQLEYAEADGVGTVGGVQSIVPNDGFHGRQWGLHNNGTFPDSPATAGADIDMHNAWEVEDGDSTIILGIIDTGLKFDHPEFSTRIWVNTAETPNNNIDDDNNGYIDDINGWDFANDDNNATDDEGHGTNVTGIIGANGNNNIGYAGVDWKCKLLVTKGIDANNSGFYSWWAEAIYYSVDKGARAINMSVGGSSNSSTLQDAINYAVTNNCAIVACMMNANTSTVYYPAGFPGVIAVGSTNANDTRTAPFFWDVNSGSNYGPHISVVAPGNYIYGLQYQSNTNYDTYWGGTSQATPHVTGVCGLLLAQNPTRTPAQLKTILEETAEDQVGTQQEDTPGFDNYYGHGRINAYQALTYVPDNVIENTVKPIATVYPNPANGAFTIALANNSAAKTAITVVDGMGRMVFNEVTALNNSTLTLPQGMYFVTLTQGVTRQTQKVVVQ